MRKTLDDILRFATDALLKAKVENAQRESRLLLESASGKGREYFMIHGNDPASKFVFDKMREYVERRVSGEPLQYILGEWEFMGDKYLVGEGVLVPRPETEMLVEIAEKEARLGATVFDVCSGTGCIGISVALRRSDINLYCVEKYDKAFGYLTDNIKMHAVKNVTPVLADMFTGAELLKLSKPDMIISNPPYVRSNDLATLQREVLREPKSALDGGGDGLMFYRALADKWFPCLKKGGLLAMECGEDQSEDLKGIFSYISDNINVVSDLNGLQRIVTVRKG